jgi:uncharacterized protein (TIGR04141 family)
MIKTHRLTIFLSKDKAKADEKLIQDIDNLTSVSLNLDGVESANLYVRKTYPHDPAWAELFSGYVESNVIGKSNSPGAVLVLRLEKATFMVTFGIGRHLVVDAWIQRDYGLKVALNSIGADKLRSIDKASHEKTPLNSRTQASKGVDIFELALNTEVDILNAITGSSKVEKFGAQLTGRDALTLNIKTNLSELISVLNETYTYYGKEDYKEFFGWVDNFRRVKDEEKLEIINNQLIEILNQDDLPDSCWLAEPEIIDWESVAYYVLEKKGKKTEYIPELRLSKLITIYKEKNKPISIESLCHHTIFVTDDNYNTLKEWSVYTCLYAELEISGEFYILQNGHWYKVEDDFVGKVNSAISSIEKYPLTFPLYKHNGEGEYNKEISNLPGYTLMDKENISHGGGQSKIEFCDLIKDGVDFIHVKRGTGSSNLSHLFAQGEVSAELFSSDSKFRAALNKKLPNELKMDDVVAQPDTKNYKIVYAIVSEKNGDLSLPFFSKVRLKNAFNYLRLLGYQVAISKIDVSDDHKVKSYGKSN